MSYADADRGVADEIGSRLGQHGHNVLRWPDPGGLRPGTFTSVEDAIEDADAFLALLSVSSLTSPSCHRQRELAMQRERCLPHRDEWPRDPSQPQALPAPGQPMPRFLHALNLGETAYHETGFLRTCGWIRLPSSGETEQAVRGLAETLAVHGPVGDSARAAPAGGSPVFRNRELEVSKILNDLTSLGGNHFWLVIAPPQLGKTWFLDKLADGIEAHAGKPWTTTMVDLHEQPAEVRRDPGALLGRMFGFVEPIGITEDDLSEIAARIATGGKPWLCLLDSADLLDRATTDTLRECLSQIYHRVPRTADIRLAVVVASRRGDLWKGVSSNPLIKLVQHLPLSQFRVDTVRQALEDLAEAMNLPFGPAQFMQWAEIVHEVSEGLPALLVQCLRWIRKRAFVEPRALQTRNVFRWLAEPYITNVLLSQGSLFPQGQAPGDESQEAVRAALRALAPYRLITMSHLARAAEVPYPDSQLPASLASHPGGPLGIDPLWEMLGRTALLTQPQDELWEQIYPPIRRLLFRYYYDAAKSPAEAHQRAGEFVDRWTRRQSDRDRVVGIVECLWHEAEWLRRTGMRPRETEQRLGALAREQARELRSQAWEAAELRRFAVRRLSQDEEFHDAVRHVPGLAESLAEIILEPGPAGSGSP
jgi:hypothetical protein